MSARNVAWYEARQDRAYQACDRIVRSHRRLIAPYIGHGGHVDLARAEALIRALQRRRTTADRYGRAKRRIGVYTDRGWVDR